MLSRTTLSRSIPHRWINPSPRIPRYPLDQLAYSHRENNLIYSQTNWTPFWRACRLALWRWTGPCRPPLERQSLRPLGANCGRDGRQVHCNPGYRVAGGSSGGVHQQLLEKRGRDLANIPGGSQPPRAGHPVSGLLLAHGHAPWGGQRGALLDGGTE